jgi:ketosteroid isomerase-like protein
MMKTDREQIQELVATYANALDDKDYDGIAACFASDATAAYGSHPQVFEGASAIADLMKKALGPLDGTQHMFTNLIIDIEGDAGRMSYDVLGQHWKKDAPGGEHYLMGGKYKVEVRRIGGKWKFQTVRARGLWGDGNKTLA